MSYIWSITNSHGREDPMREAIGSTTGAICRLSGNKQIGNFYWAVCRKISDANLQG